MNDLVKGPLVDGPGGAARELKAMLEALQAEKATLEKWHEVAVVELNDAHARIAELAAALVGAREALRETVGLIGAPSDFDGLRNTDTVDHTITVSIGQVKRWAALLRKIEGDPA
jgi:hypothetical protein